MKFDDLDKRMRVYETASDQCVLPGVNIVARLDGRSFTKLTKETRQFEAPFDEQFRDLMVATTRHLTRSAGFNVVYAFTASDEISLLLERGEQAFNRKLRKLISVLAGEASAALSLELQDRAVFDCRVSQLPGRDDVIDYFRWRNEDARRNALNAHCYWTLRRAGSDVAQATAALRGLSVAEKNELLFERGLNFNDVPPWQKRGVGLYWQTERATGVDPRSGRMVETTRRQLRIDFQLPMKQEYSQFLERLIDGQ